MALSHFGMQRTETLNAELFHISAGIVEPQRLHLEKQKLGVGVGIHNP